LAKDEVDEDVLDFTRDVDVAEEGRRKVSKHRG